MLSALEIHYALFCKAFVVTCIYYFRPICGDYVHTATFFGREKVRDRGTASARESVHDETEHGRAAKAISNESRNWRGNWSGNESGSRSWNESESEGAI